MLLFWCDWTYLAALAASCALLILVLRTLLVWRRQRRRAGKPSSVLLKTLLTVWFLSCLLFLLEISFAAFYDTTDAFNATNVSARWFRRHVEAFRNTEGFRDRREFTEARPKDTFRICMFGDSFTIAQGIENMSDRFSDLCESKLNADRSSAGESVQVYNFGEFGWEVSMVEAMVNAMFDQGYEVDQVVYIYMLNDIEGYDPRTEEIIRSVQKTQPTNPLITDSYFLNWMHFLWQQYQAKRTVDYFPHLADSYREAPWQGVVGKLQSIHDACQANGAEFRMVFFPFLHNLGENYEFKHAHQQLADFCNSRDIRYLDLEPILSKHRTEGLTVNRYDNHPNERCHAIVAEAMCRELFDDVPQERNAE